MHRHLEIIHRRAPGLGLAVLVAAMPAAVAAQDAAAPSGDWSGWYLGATLDTYDTAVRETELDEDGALNGIFDYSGDGGGFGVHTGRLWQRDAMTYGFEFGVSAGPSAAYVIDADNAYFYDTGLMLALKGRVGYVMTPRTHVYATAGLSMGNLDFDWTAAGNRETGKVWSTGYTIGFGVEHRIGDADALRFGVDYLRRDSDDFAAPTILDGVSYSNEWKQVTVSVGFTHFFGD